LLSGFLSGVYLVRRGFPLQKTLFWLSMALSLLVAADALRILPTPDIIATAGESAAWWRRPYALEHPNVVAGWILLGAGAWSLPALIITQSRGALLGWLGAAFVARLRSPRARMVVLLAGGTLFTLLLIMRPETAAWRIIAWRQAIELWQEAPIFGQGTGIYRELGILDTAHNAVLTILAENGIVGVFVFVLWLKKIASRVAASASPAKWWLLAFAIQNLVDDTWTHPITALVLGLALALACHLKDESY